MGTRHKRFNPVTKGGLELLRVVVVQYMDADGEVWVDAQAQSQEAEMDISLIVGVAHRGIRVLEDQHDARE